MRKLDSSEIFLIVANIFPIIGIFFFDWSIFSVLIAYWVETGVVLFYALVKGVYLAINRKKKEDVSEVLFSIILNIAMYGCAMLIYFAVILNLAYPFSGIETTLSGVFKEYIKEIILMTVVFLISHGQSFYFNLIKNKEAEKIEVKELLSDSAHELFIRFLFMQSIAIIGWWIFEVTKGPIYLYVLFIIAKTLIDLNGHRKKHEMESYKNFVPDKNTPKPKYVHPQSYLL